MGYRIIQYMYEIFNNNFKIINIWCCEPLNSSLIIILRYTVNCGQPYSPQYGTDC